MKQPTKATPKTSATKRKPATSKAEPSEKIGDLFDQFGELVARLMSHSECPRDLSGYLSEMMCSISGDASNHPGCDSYRNHVEARILLPFNLQILRQAEMLKAEMGGATK